tara:strand:+ start:28579 stop:28908 length:330 start_codon:yes stop_codon:yes gene_type:complete
MESLEDLKVIIDNAPEGATIVDIEVDGFIDYLYVDKDAGDGEKIKSCANGGGGDGAIEYSNGNIRALSDIERIIELMELSKDMHTTVSGYLCGDEWEHWQEFNAGKFKL